MKALQITTLAAAFAMLSMTIAVAHGDSPCTIGNDSGAYLGITGQPAQVQGVRGVRVVADQIQRDLYRDTPYGTQIVHFRVGYDVVYRINGRNVYSPRDVLASLQYGTNQVEIYDSYTRSYETVRVEIDGGPTFCN